MAAFDEFLRFIYATIARFIPKKNVYRNMCTRSREREEADEGCVKICKRVQRPLGASGAVWITTPPHIIVPSFWRGWKLIRRIQSEAKKRVDEKRKKKKRKISPRSCLLNSAIQLDHFFFLFLFVQVEERRDYRQRGKEAVCFATSRSQNDAVPQGGLRLRWQVAWMPV